MTGCGSNYGPPSSTMAQYYPFQLSRCIKASFRIYEECFNFLRPWVENDISCGTVIIITIYSGDPVSDRLTKRAIPEYGPPFFSPEYFTIHIMYYQIQKADRPAIRDTDHPFSVSNHKRTRKTDQQKNNNSHFYSYRCIN